MSYPSTLKKVMECYKKLPGIGEKTAERLALATLNFDEDIIDVFADSIKNLKNKVKRCKKCNNLCEEEYCEICSNNTRDKKTICVVEEAKNVILFEKVGSYNGLYHVLDGLISPLDGIHPEDINIENLIKRIEEEHIEEVIIAVKSSIEGKTTSLYILKRLEKTGVKVSKIAHGIPLGADIDYMDNLTLEMALQERTIIETKN